MSSPPVHLCPDLSTSRLRGACVCVCVTFGVTRFLLECVLLPIEVYAGGSSPLMSLLPTKLLMSWDDIGADHSDVPAWLWRLQAVTPIFW